MDEFIGWCIVALLVYFGWLARGWNREKRVRDERLPSGMRGALKWHQVLRYQMFWFPEVMGIPDELLSRPADAFQVWGRHAAMRAWLAHTELKHRRERIEPKDWQWRRVAAFERSDGLCDRCNWGDGAAQLHVHHRRPRGDGGDHRLSNLVTLCSDCHMREHDLLKASGVGHYFPPMKYTESRSASQPARMPARSGSDPEDGYCIRCSRRIALDPQRPLCGACYSTWAEFQNEDYAEKHCHECGLKTQTTYAKPLCGRCYSEGF